MVAGEQFGIGEPTGEEFTNLDAVELIMVPGVAFDRTGNRMGRGRGFYDRLLKSTPNATKIGLAYDFQMMDAIPTEPHDVKMNLVITD
jgi:5-formyltetrahydrofolate cyclo-ligase